MEENKINNLHITPVIIGLVGPWYAGKRAFANYLNSLFSVSRIISITKWALKDAANNNNPIENEDTDKLREHINWRRKRKGKDYFVKLLPLKEVENYTLLIIRSLKNVEEVNYVKSIGGIIVGINADPEIRYRRYVKQVGAAAVSLESFIKNEARDFPTLQETLKLAKVVYVNNEEDFEKPNSKFHFNFCFDFVNSLPAHLSEFNIDHKLYNLASVNQLENSSRNRTKEIVHS